MAKNILTPRITLPAHPLDIVSDRLQQALAIVVTIDDALTDRKDEPEHGGLTDCVLEKLAWAASELLEQAERAHTAFITRSTS